MSNQTRQRVRLEVVEGTDEFADLIDQVGVLVLNDADHSRHLNWFQPDEGEHVSLTVKQVRRSGGEISVFTRLGNCFRFSSVAKDTQCEPTSRNA